MLASGIVGSIIERLFEEIAIKTAASLLNIFTHRNIMHYISITLMPKIRYNKGKTAVYFKFDPSTEIKSIDYIKMYNAFNRIRGEVQRLYPKQERGLKWRIYGYVLHNSSLYGVFSSHNDHSESYGSFGIFQVKSNVIKYGTYSRFFPYENLKKNRLDLNMEWGYKNTPIKIPLHASVNPIVAILINKSDIDEVVNRLKYRKRVNICTPISDIMDIMSSKGLENNVDIYFPGCSNNNG